MYLGIDLGTSNSLIAYYDETAGRAICCPNSEGSLFTASAVCFYTMGNIIVGNEAKELSLIYPERSALMFKSMIGKADKAATVAGKSYSPSQLSAMVLESLVRDAGDEIGREVRDAVIAVPAYYDSRERQAVIKAGAMAGLHVIDVIDEPVAAACYIDTMENIDGKFCLVFDLGGGTLDITAICVKKESIDIIAATRDKRLGGTDWDSLLIDHIKNKVFKGLKLDTRADQELKIKAESAKKLLSKKTEARFTVSTPEGRKEVNITRGEFEKCTEPLLRRAEKLFSEFADTLKKEEGGAPERIILSGGAAQMPQIIRMLRRVCPDMEIIDREADKAVACGAAIYARMLERGEQRRIKRLSRLARKSYGVAAFFGSKRKIVNMLFRNQKLPQEAEAIFQTRYDNQDKIEITVYENDAVTPYESLERGSVVGTCTLDINGSLPAGTPISICIHLAEDGVLQVSAHEKSGHTAIKAYMRE